MKKKFYSSSVLFLLLLTITSNAQSISFSPNLQQDFDQDNPVKVQPVLHTTNKTPEIKKSYPSVMACDSLPTTFAGGNGQSGNMFDIVALKKIMITYFEGHIDPTVPALLEIYYKAGSYMGSETDSTAWTLIDTTTVTSAGTGIPTFINIPINIIIPTGQTYAFYITSQAGVSAMDYTNGTAQGSPFASNADLQVLEGVGKSYPFASTYPSSGTGSRQWNGIVHYCDSASMGISKNDVSTKLTIAPNPLNENATITITNKNIRSGSDITLKIYDMLGNEIRSITQINSTSGRSVADFDRGNLKSGIYFLRFEDEHGAIRTEKLIAK